MPLPPSPGPSGTSRDEALARARALATEVVTDVVAVGTPDDQAESVIRAELERRSREQQEERLREERRQEIRENLERLVAELEATSPEKGKLVRRALSFILPPVTATPAKPRPRATYVPRRGPRAVRARSRSPGRPADDDPSEHGLAALVAAEVRAARTCPRCRSETVTDRGRKLCPACWATLFCALWGDL